MRRYANILPICLLLAAMPYMLGAVVLIDPSSEIEKQLPDSGLPDAHGPAIDLPTESVVIEHSPAILDQPIEPAEADKDTTGDDKPAIKKETPKLEIPKKSSAEKAVKKAAPEKTEPELEPLSPGMEALRDRVRQALKHYSQQPLNTKNNTPDHILKSCLAFGCDTAVRQDGPSGESINGFTCLCWNYPCGGYNLLKMVDGHISARVGYGLQSNPAEFLAVLALSRVPSEYPIRSGKTVRTVADLVESEKLACRSGGGNALRLIGLARYTPSNAVWNNSLGEKWSVSRLLKDELDNAQEPAPYGGTQRLMAISYAADRRAQRGQPIDGQFKRAKKYIDKYQDYALAVQGANGSWHPSFFKYRGEGGTSIGRVNSTGRILAWLVSSLPDEELDDQRIVNAVSFLTNMLTGRRYNGLTSTSAADIAARMNAVHALSVYNRRKFDPYDKAAEEAEALQAVQSAALYK